MSAPPVAVIVAEAAFCHDADPPETVGAVGAVWSSITVSVASGTAGTQFDV